jgi:hypothetical protein
MPGHYGMMERQKAKRRWLEEAKPVRSRRQRKWL